MSSSFPEHLSSLLQPAAYPHVVAAVQLIETHISWILLTGEFAYKIKRPVQYPFVDLRSAQRRAFLCAEEIRLNRRFAADLYLEVCQITRVHGKARIAGDGEVIEHAVRMRQFQHEQELDQLLAAGEIATQELETFGRYLAAIHERLPVAREAQPYGEPSAVRALIVENLAQYLQVAPARGAEELALALRGPCLARLDAAEPWIRARRRGDRVRECHGDLHTRNIVRHAGHLVAFDCLEFEPAFRWIDVADEIAFLLMDLDARHFGEHAQAFLGGYLAHSGDFQACRLLRLYITHRALVKAKVAALTAASTSDPGAREAATREHDAYLECARRQLAQRRSLLLLMHGVSGSGKTWLAQQLAPALGAVHLRSDVERKRAAGLAETARSQSALEQGLYSRAASERVYERLAQCAQDALAGGYPVILDATFQRREPRARFQELAARLGAQLFVVHCHAPGQVLEARVAQRHDTQADASEADLAVLEWQQAQLEPIGADEHLAVIDADTTRADLLTAVAGRLHATLHDEAQ